MTELQKGQRVRVFASRIDPHSNLIGATGTLITGYLESLRGHVVDIDGRGEMVFEPDELKLLEG